MVKKFKSRYGDERIITLLEDGSYRVEGRTLFTRHADGMVDFEGGPCLMVGDRLLGVKDDLVIKSLNIDDKLTVGDYAAVVVTMKQAKRGKSRA
jgi:hypothetical protein